MSWKDRIAERIGTRTNPLIEKDRKNFVRAHPNSYIPYSGGNSAWVDETEYTYPDGSRLVRMTNICNKENGVPVTTVLRFRIGQ